MNITLVTSQLYIYFMHLHIHKINPNFTQSILHEFLHRISPKKSHCLKLENSLIIILQILLSILTPLILLSFILSSGHQIYQEKFAKLVFHRVVPEQVNSRRFETRRAWASHHYVVVLLSSRVSTLDLILPSRVSLFVPSFSTFDVGRLPKSWVRVTPGHPGTHHRPAGCVLHLLHVGSRLHRDRIGILFDSVVHSGSAKTVNTVTK